MDSKRCSHCGKTVSVNNFYRNKNSGDGRESYCKGCVRAYRRGLGYNEKQKAHLREVGRSEASKLVTLSRQDKYRKTCKYRFVFYKHSAKIRGHSFGISYEQFATFWRKPCHYCGDEIASIGLDRMDNNIGYEIGNLVPCCTKCNQAKLSQGYDEYIQRCIRVSDNHKK